MTNKGNQMTNENRLRAELKTALDERDDARRMYCIVRMRISNKPEPTDTSQSLGWEGLWQGRPHSNSETRKKNYLLKHKESK